MPPSLRFFTGGDQTVRGYGYETISPRGSDGKLLGGRYVSVASAEYNYRFSDKWLGALFVDSGTATVDYSEAWKIGTGVGVRWVTPSVRSGSIWRWAFPRRRSRCDSTSRWGLNYDPARLHSSYLLFF